MTMECPIPKTNADWEAHWKAMGVWIEPTPKTLPPERIEVRPEKPTPDALRRTAARLGVDTAAVALTVALVDAQDAGHNPTLEVLRQRLVFAIAEWAKADPACPMTRL